MVFEPKLDPHIYTELDFTVPIPARVCGVPFNFKITFKRYTRPNVSVALSLDRINPTHEACIDCPKFLVCRTRPCLFETCLYGCDKDTTWAWHVSYPDVATQHISCPAVPTVFGGVHYEHHFMCPVCLAKKLPDRIKTAALALKRVYSPVEVPGILYRKVHADLSYSGWAPCAYDVEEL